MNALIIIHIKMLLQKNVTLNHVQKKFSIVHVMTIVLMELFQKKIVMEQQMNLMNVNVILNLVIGI